MIEVGAEVGVAGGAEARPLRVEESDLAARVVRGVLGIDEEVLRADVVAAELHRAEVGDAQTSSEHAMTSRAERMAEGLAVKEPVRAFRLNPDID